MSLQRNDPTSHDDSLSKTLVQTEEYFRILQGSQANIEVDFSKKPVFPVGLEENPTRVKIKETKPTIASESFTNRFSDLPPELQVTTKTFTQNSVEVQYATNENLETAKSEYPLTHFEVDYPSPILIFNKDGPIEPVPNQNNPLKDIDLELQNNSNSEKQDEVIPRNAQTPTGTSLTFTGPRYNDQDFAVPAMDGSINGRQICGLLFGGNEEPERWMSLTGIHKAEDAAPLHENLVVTLSDYAFPNTPVKEIEPVYFTMALYQFDPHRKLTEDIHVDLNSDDLLKMQGNHHTNAHDVTAPRSFLFPINTNATSEAFLVIKVLHNISRKKKNGTEDYFLPEKKAAEMRSNAAPSKIQKKVNEIKKEYSSMCNSLHNYRQVMGVASIPIISYNRWKSPDPESPEWKDDEKLDIIFTDMYLLECNPDEYELGKYLDLVNRKKKSPTIIPTQLSLSLLKTKKVPEKTIVTVEMEKFIPGNATPEEREALLRKQPPTSLIRRVQSFLPPPLPLNSSSFFHFLYITPLFLDLNKFKPFLAQNITIRVRVFQNDFQVPAMDPGADHDGLPVIMGRSNEQAKLKEHWCNAIYHNKQPHFDDEIKLALPFKLENEFHILFDFFHISVLSAQEKSKKGKTSKQLLKYIGSTCLPLDTDSICNDTPSKHKVTDKLNSRYVKSFRDESDAHLNYLFDGEKRFTVQVRLVSTIIPLDDNIRYALVTSSDGKDDKFELQLDDISKDILPVTVGTEYKDSTMISMKKEAASIFFPSLADITISRLWKGTFVQEMDRHTNVKRRLFELMDLFNLSQSTIFSTNPADIKDDVLVDFIERKYLFWDTGESKSHGQDHTGNIVTAYHRKGKSVHEIFLRVVTEVMMELTWHEMKRKIITAIHEFTPVDRRFQELDKKPAKHLKKGEDEELAKLREEKKEVDDWIELSVHQHLIYLVEERRVHRTVEKVVEFDINKPKKLVPEAPQPVMDKVPDEDIDDDIARLQEAARKEKEAEEERLRKEEEQKIQDDIDAKTKEAMDRVKSSLHSDLTLDSTTTPRGKDAAVGKIRLFIIKQHLPMLDSWVDSVNFSRMNASSEPLIHPSVVDGIIHSSDTPNEQKRFNEFMNYCKVFMCFILKSMSIWVIPDIQLQTDDDIREQKMRERRDRFTPQFYSLLKSFVVLTAVASLLKTTPGKLTSWIPNLAHFISQLWMLCDRGLVNEIILLFLIHFKPLAIKGQKTNELSAGANTNSTTPFQPLATADVSTFVIQTDAQINRILQTTLDFWSVLTQSSQWLPQAFLSGSSGGSQIIPWFKTPECTQKSYVFFLPHLLMQSVFECQQRAFLSDFKEKVEDDSKSKTHLKTASNDEGFDDDDDDLEEGVAVDDAIQTFDIVQERAVKPFRFMQQFFTQFDTRSEYQSPLVRMVISRVHFAFVQMCVDKIDELDVPTLLPEEKVNCYASCVWLLSNSPMNVMRTFIFTMPQAQHHAFFKLLRQIFEYFQPSYLMPIVHSPFGHNAAEKDEIRADTQDKIAMMYSVPQNKKGLTVADRRAKVVRYQKRAQSTTTASTSPSPMEEDSSEPVTPQPNPDASQMSSPVAKSPLQASTTNLSQTGSPFQAMALPNSFHERSQSKLVEWKNLKKSKDKHEKYTEYVSKVVFTTTTQHIISVLTEFIALTAHPTLKQQMITPGNPVFRPAIRKTVNGTVIQTPILLGEENPFHRILLFFENNATFKGAETFSLTLNNAEEQKDSFVASAVEKASNMKVSTLVSFIANLFFKKGNLGDKKITTARDPISLEAIIQLLNLLYFVVKMFADSFFNQSIEYCSRLVVLILPFFHSQSSTVRNLAIDIIYNMLKLNVAVNYNMLRMRIILAQFVVDNKMNKDKLTLFIQCIQEFPNRAALDKDSTARFVRMVNETARRLSKIATDYINILSSSGDLELRAEQGYNLTLDLYYEPQHRLNAFSTLEQSLGRSNLDEVAIMHAMKASIQLDIMSEYWRSQPKSTVGFPFPQYLPIRSDLSIFDREGGSIEIHPRDSLLLPSESYSDIDDNIQSLSIPAPPAPKMKLSRRYGTGWCSWNQQLLRLIPDLQLYDPKELYMFVSNPDMNAALNDTKLFTYDALVKQLELTASMCDGAQLFEYSLCIRKILVSLFQAQDDMIKLSNVYEEMASNVGASRDVPCLSRLTCYYYRVGLYGYDFGEENGAVYVSREYNRLTVGDFKFRLIDKYKRRFNGKEVKIIMDASVPELSEEDLKTPHIQLAAVKPIFSDLEDSDRPTSFLKETGLSVFSLENPFTKTPIKKPGMHETWLRKVKEGGMKIDEITPGMFSVRDLITKTVAIRKATDPLDAKGIQPLVSGAIAPQVNEGVMSVFRCFLGEHKDETSEEDQAEIKASFFAFFNVCRDALCKMSVLTMVPGFLDALVEKYNTLLDEVSAEIGNLKKIEKGVDY
ncbi:putative dedicator of cytokinesis protein 11 [Blattamonas nauphoetae]|uniref:Dedicator of cytokinesis protein 11 n=1 Tax=Blattamonas nauphoetae TaxID=2049346 RepID=A0ABQ9Y007_9EUKA|nr:putative dedicator of cytokinesis protein 11 [Blattamonas nauphoetae]